MRSSGYKDVEGELTLDSLRTFVADNGIDLAANIDAIKVRVSDEHDKGYRKPVKYFLDYVDDERHFLLDGKWHVFNQNYIEYLRDQVDRIALEVGVNFVTAEFEKWRTSGKEQTLTYAEAYFNEMRESEGYMNLDRSLSTIQKKYKIEKMDLWKDDTLYFVKLGTPQKLSFVIDQSLATMKVLQNKITEIKLAGAKIEPKKMCLWIILERQSEIQKLSDIKSLIFLMKLSEWQRQCANAGYQPLVRVGYRK